METAKKDQMVSGNKKGSKLPKTKNLSSSDEVENPDNFIDTKSSLASDALSRSEKRFYTLYYQSPIAIEHFDKRGKLIDVNPSCLSLFGVNNLEDLRNFDLFTDPNISEEQKKMLKRKEIVQYQGLFNFEKVKKFKLYPTKKSGKIWIDSRITPLINNQDTIDGYLVQVFDITDRMIANKTIRESEEKYRTLFENVQDVFYKIDMNGNFMEISPSIKYFSEFDRDELIGQLAIKIYANSKDRVLFLNNLMKTGELRDYELKLKSRTGKIIYSSINARIIFNRNGKPAYIAGAIRDITERKLAEEALHESEEKYRLLFENATQGIAVAQDENFQFVNQSFCDLFGYTKEEILSIPIINALCPDDREMVIGNYKKRLNGETAPQNYQFRIIRKDKTCKWVELNAVVFKWQGKNASLNFFSDITDRKKAEDELHDTIEQLHQLTKYIEEVRELERLAISRELHDDLGQALTAVIIDLSMIKKKITDQEIIHKIEKASTLVSNTIKSVQRITSNLRPDMINDLGLDAALEYYVIEFADRSGIKVSLNIDQGINFTTNTSLNIFRIIQESLTNIARHAKATKVDVMLKKSFDSVCIKISDDGIGVNEDDVKSKKSFGIMSMKERAQSLGGTLEIYKKNNKGTEIKLILPLSKI